MNNKNLLHEKFKINCADCAEIFLSTKYLKIIINDFFLTLSLSPRNNQEKYNK